MPSLDSKECDSRDCLPSVQLCHEPAIYIPSDASAVSYGGLGAKLRFREATDRESHTSDQIMHSIFLGVNFSSRMLVKWLQNFILNVIRRPNIVYISHINTCALHPILDMIFQLLYIIAVELTHKLTIYGNTFKLKFE